MHGRTKGIDEFAFSQEEEEKKGIMNNKNRKDHDLYSFEAEEDDVYVYDLPQTKNKITSISPSKTKKTTAGRSTLSPQRQLKSVSPRRKQQLVKGGAMKKDNEVLQQKINQLQVTQDNIVWLSKTRID